MRIGPVETVNCPHCGATNPAADATCHACSKRLMLYIGPARTLPRKFGLGPLMILVAIVAVGLGIFRIAPPVGVLMLFLFVPAMIRTTGVASQRAEDRRPTTLEDKAWVFLTSIGLMTAVLVSSCLAFIAVCLPAGLVAANGRGYGFVLVVAVGGGAALLVGGVVLRSFWSYRG